MHCEACRNELEPGAGLPRRTPLRSFLGRPKRPGAIIRVCAASNSRPPLFYSYSDVPDRKDMVAAVAVPACGCPILATRKRRPILATRKRQRPNGPEKNHLGIRLAHGACPFCTLMHKRRQEISSRPQYRTKWQSKLSRSREEYIVSVHLPRPGTKSIRPYTRSA
jgi:hypothetical protein